MTEVRVFVRSGVASDDRSLLTAAVASAAGCHPSTVTVMQSCANCGSLDHGAPVVESPAGWFVSLSRVGSLVAVAVTDVAAVGLDIESVAAVAAHPVDGVSSAREWCGKEAVLKACGVGLRVSPELLTFSGDVLELWPESLGLEEAPGVAWFALSEGVVGAVAVLAAGVPVVAVVALPLVG